MNKKQSKTTITTTIVGALNGICPYYTMYPLDFPLTVLRRAVPEDWVFDPFCGRGTTNFAARLRNLHTIGVDSNPLAVAIAAAKVVATSPDDIVLECQRLLETDIQNVDVPDGEFWQLCYEEATLHSICLLRKHLLLDCTSEVRIALRAILLGALHGPQLKTKDSYFSNQMPRSYASKPDYSVRYWKAKGLEPRQVEVLAIVRERANRYFKASLPTVQGMIVWGDSRNTRISPPHPIRWIITSPPYYGMRTYIPDQWLRNWFLGGPAEVTYSTDSQISHSSPAVFAEELAAVWKAVASIADDGAHLVIRFGGIHDRRSEPRKILKESLRLAGNQWRLLTARSAGYSSTGKRQAEQFVRGLKQPIEEYDFYARLE